MEKSEILCDYQKKNITGKTESTSTNGGSLFNEMVCFIT